MRIDVLTTLPEMFRGPLDESILLRARQSGQVEIRLVNLRDYTHDRHKKTDDEQFGGGDGMVMKAEPILEALDALSADSPGPCEILFTSPQGERFDHAMAMQLSRVGHLVIVCGHYKGIDERAIQLSGGREVSIGDYILTGGELPAMVVIDAVVRLLPGVVGSYASVEEDSFYQGLLDCPRYTRPQEVRGVNVPEVLLSGHHAEIEKWRRQQAEERTRLRRPDLWEAFLRRRHAEREP
ncbi:tRNA (guanosine(37)-N1)-methyltransferase TrmD [bacterium]|nr:tRNA (guanosine(37)-N1)-methyltransferase TrmD [bacterium]